MQIEGVFPIAAPRAQVWTMIRDPRIMANCLPGCKEAEETESGAYRVVVALKVGPIKARFHLLIEIAAEVPPKELSCRTRGEEGSRASQISAESWIRLDETATKETELRYRSEVKVTGRLGKFGLGVMRKKADQIAAAFAEALQARVQSESVA